jgi:hypothetical protein
MYIQELLGILIDNPSKGSGVEDRVLPYKRCDEFCSFWIPRIYDIQRDEPRYKEACIDLFCKEIEGFNPENAYRNWRWQDSAKPYVPDYLPSLLKLLDQKYTILEKLGHLPKYKLPPTRQF